MTTSTRTWHERRPLVAAVMALMMVCGLAAGASAAEPDVGRDRAARLVAEGIELALARDFRAAIPKFEEANRLFPHPDIQHSLGRAHEELGALKIAHHWFGLALREDYTYAADARERIARIEAALRKTHARLAVRATPTDVQVQITHADGTRESNLTTPFQTWALAGKLRVVGTNPEFRPTTREIDVVPGEDRQVNLVLEPLPKQGFFQVIGNVPGVQVFLNEVLVATLPMQSVPFPVGVYEMKVSARGYLPHRRQVVIEPDALSQVTVVLEPDASFIVEPEPVPPPPGRVPTWVGATAIGLGVVATGVGVFLHAEAHRINGEANRIPIPTPPDPQNPEDEARYDRLFESARSHQGWAIGNYIGGGALVLTGVILLTMFADGDGPSDDSVASPRWTPGIAVSGDGAAGGVSVRF